MGALFKSGIENVKSIRIPSMTLHGCDVKETILDDGTTAYESYAEVRLPKKVKKITIDKLEINTGYFRIAKYDGDTFISNLYSRSGLTVNVSINVPKEYDIVMKTYKTHPDATSTSTPEVTLTGVTLEF